MMPLASRERTIQKIKQQSNDFGDQIVKSTAPRFCKQDNVAINDGQLGTPFGSDPVKRFAREKADVRQVVFVMPV